MSVDTSRYFDVHGVGRIYHGSQIRATINGEDVDGKVFISEKEPGKAWVLTDDYDDGSPHLKANFRMGYDYSVKFYYDFSRRNFRQCSYNIQFDWCQPMKETKSGFGTISAAPAVFQPLSSSDNVRVEVVDRHRVITLNQNF